jgi:DNA-directed RNA polymerase subunit RPC12/RpoP
MAKLKAVKYPGSRYRGPRTLYECSACGRNLDRTARFCLDCGAWFTNKRAK